MSDADQGRGAPPAGPVSDRLQALLARAAEEQLSEQRQLSSVLAELRTLVAGLDEHLRSSGPRPDAPVELSVDVAALADALAPRVADLLAERLSSSVAEQVTRAAQDVEQRLATHVDEAVLALASVLLRPRRSGSSAPDAAPGPGAAAPDAGAGRTLSGARRLPWPPVH